ncbi:MAG: hypothetical protein IH944_05545 [Armatimonadetes bacterium]|nr:hypothetical protein [Armatimonadota bacterium]
MEFLAKLAASLLTALAALAANVTPSPAIPVAATAEVDHPAVTAQLHEPEPSAIESDCQQIEEIVLAAIHGDSAHFKLLIVSSEATAVTEPFDLSGLLDGSWSPKSNAILALPWYVDQQQDCRAFFTRLSNSPQLAR